MTGSPCQRKIRARGICLADERLVLSLSEGFADKRQYVLAEEKYDDLLRRFGDDRKGILDYARMESTRLADYEKADTLLKRLLDRTMYDYDALLATGDNRHGMGRKVPAKLD